MSIHNFVLSYYENAVDGIHIQRRSASEAASKPHMHTYFQIYYVAKGSLTHYVGNASSVLTRGDMFIIPPGTSHHITRGTDAEFYSFSFMPDTFGEPTDSNRLAVGFLRTLEKAGNDHIHPKITVPSDEVLHIESIMSEMLRTFQQKNLGYGEALRAYGILLLNLFVRVYYETMPDKFQLDTQSSRQAVLLGIQYIDQNFTEQLTLDDIARRCAISKSCFCSQFTAITGTTFHKYLNTCRVNHAVGYIKKGYKLTSIYGLCGYSDFSTFYRNFKKVTGLSPEEYRQLHG